MIECVYYNDFIRCYRDGSVERFYKTVKKWSKYKSYTTANGYFAISINNKTYQLHRIIAFCFGKLEQIEAINHTNDIDHINGIRTDNRVENLRQVTNHQNQWNRTKAKGYTWHKPTKKWKAQIQLNGKPIHLGLYDTEEEARNAYLRAKEIHHVI
jgi:hypothetical protein